MAFELLLCSIFTVWPIDKTDTKFRVFEPTLWTYRPYHCECLLNVIKPNSPPYFSIARRVHIQAGNVRDGNTLLGRKEVSFPSFLPSYGATFTLLGPALTTGDVISTNTSTSTSSCFLCGSEEARKAKLFKLLPPRGGEVVLQGREAPLWFGQCFFFYFYFYFYFFFNR